MDGMLIIGVLGVLPVFSAPVNVKAESVQMKALPVPPNPAQVPKPLEPHRVKDQVPVQLPPHHQSEFT